VNSLLAAAVLAAIRNEDTRPQHNQTQPERTKMSPSRNFIFNFCCDRCEAIGAVHEARLSSKNWHCVDDNSLCWHYWLLSNHSCMRWRMMILTFRVRRWRLMTRHVSSNQSWQAQNSKLKLSVKESRKLRANLLSLCLKISHFIHPDKNI